MIALSPTFARASAKITVLGLGATGLRRYGDGRWMTIRGGLLRDYFRGLEVKIYVAPPAGFG